MKTKNYMNSDMHYLVVGLGNPGTQYAETRHNIGWAVLDKLELELKDPKRSYFDTGTTWSGKLPRHHATIITLRPSTYMNLSGEAVAEAVKKFDVQSHQIIVVYDDMDIPVGRIRVRPSGASGGHRGIESIINHLNTADFPRVRVGIGSATEPRLKKDYVLAPIPKDEQMTLDKSTAMAAKASVSVVKGGVSTAMNWFNSRSAA